MQIKSKPATNNLCHSNPLIKTCFEIMQLKNLYRQGWLRHGINKAKCESVAEHSFGTAMISSMIARQYFPQLELSKILQLALIHDIAEVYAGDVTPHDQISKADQYRNETIAFKKIFENLANSEHYLELWSEYLEQSSAEAKLVKQIDKLEMLIQASIYESQEAIDLSEFFESADPQIIDSQLRELLREIRNPANKK